MIQFFIEPSHKYDSSIPKKSKTYHYLIVSETIILFHFFIDLVIEFICR